MKKNRRMKLINLIKEHIKNNAKEYIIVTLIFIIGIFAGVFFLNNMQEAPKTDVTNYLNNFITKLKENQNLDMIGLFKNSIMQNLILGVVIWFFGTTVIGIPIVFGLVLYRGFCLGYTISTTILVLGLTKGLTFSIIALLIQNILFIPAILALAVSGFKLYKSIIKDKRKENIKLEILRHTIFSLIMLILLIISAIIEIFISTNILCKIIKYF